MVALSSDFRRGRRIKPSDMFVRNIYVLCSFTPVDFRVEDGYFPGKWKQQQQQPSLHCSSVSEQREGSRESLCGTHNASRPITRLRVALKPIGSTQLRLKIDNRSESSRESKALLENSAPIFVSSLTAFKSEKSPFKRLSLKNLCTVPVKKKVCCYYMSVFRWRIIQC